MRKALIYTFCALSCLNYVHADTATDQRNVAVEQTKAYSNKEKGFAITFPSNWEQKEGALGLDVIALSPVENANDPFRENVSVLSGELDPAINLETFFSENVKNLGLDLKEFKSIDSGEKTINGRKMKWIHYQHAIGNTKLEVLQYFLVANNHWYIITSSAEESSFPKYQKDFETVIQSFKLNP